MNRTLTFVVAGLAIVMILLLAVVFILVLQDVLSPQADADPTLVPTAQALAPTATVLAELPPPAIDVPPTFTPPPTSEATDTPEQVAPQPTNTPAPTNTLPPPTLTNTPVPVVLPTNTSAPPAPPTNTPVPEPPPQDTRGLVATSFNIQSRSDFRVNQQVWFDFELVNTTGGEVAYNRLGVMPRKDGADRLDWFQQSYGGPNATIKPQGLVHEDNIKLPEAGTYTLRLAICFDGWESCNSGGGNWATLSQEVPVTIN